METEEPAGCRSTTRLGRQGRGGSWNVVRDQEGRNNFLIDLENLTRGLAESDDRLLRRELLSRMRRAQEGRLSYGEGSGADVCQMQRHRCILEVRLRSHVSYDNNDPLDGDPVPRLVRLYFNEPASVPDVLLHISLRGKCPGPIGVQEQNSHVDEAYGRLFHFEAYLSRNDMTLAAYSR